MKENLEKSPLAGHSLRIVIDLTPEETAAEFRGRSDELAQLRAAAELLKERESRMAKLRSMVGL